MTESTPIAVQAPPASKPATAASATAWFIALVTIALGLTLFIFLALIATWAGAQGA